MSDRDDLAPLAEFVSRVAGGGTPTRSSPSNWSGPIPWASVKDLVQDRLFLEDTEEHISARALHESASSLIPAGIPVMCTRMAVGRVAIPTVDIAINQDLKALFPAEDVDARYLLQGISFLQPRLEAVATGSTVKGLQIRELLAFRLYKPSISEQRRIAGILDTLDNQIRSSERVLAKLRATRRGLANQLLMFGVDDTGRAKAPVREPAEFRETALGYRPHGWSVSPLREFLLRCDYGISTSLADEGRIPVLRMNNFADGEAKIDNLKYSDSSGAARLTLSSGDVLFNRTNSMDHVGRTGIWRGQLDVVSFASYLVRLVPNERLTNEYLNHVLNLRQTQIDLRRWATPGVHQVNVNPTNLRRVVVAVPDSLSEQDRICESLANHDARIERERGVLSKLRNQKAGLVADLLSGRVRVPEGVVS